MLLYVLLLLYLEPNKYSGTWYQVRNRQGYTRTTYTKADANTAATVSTNSGARVCLYLVRVVDYLVHVYVDVVR